MKGNHDTQLKAQLQKLSKQQAEALSQTRDNHETQMKAAREHHEASAAGCMRLVLLKDSMLVMHSMNSPSAQISMKARNPHDESQICTWLALITSRQAFDHGSICVALSVSISSATLVVTTSRTHALPAKRMAFSILESNCVAPCYHLNNMKL